MSGSGTRRWTGARVGALCAVVLACLLALPGGVCAEEGAGGGGGGEGAKGNFKKEASEAKRGEDTRWYNHDSLVAGVTVHSFAGDAGPISPFLGYGLKWDTFSDFMGVSDLKDETIWEFIGLGLEVFYFQSLTDYPAELAVGANTLEFDSSMFQVGILATLIYLPGRFHPMLGIGFTWTELSAADETELTPGSEIFPMLDSQLGLRVDLVDALSIDLSLYGNWGRDGNIALGESRNIFFFSTFLGLSWNII